MIDLALQHPCPHCHSKAQERCTRTTGAPGRYLSLAETHRARVNQVCGATFIGSHSFLGEQDMRCARLAGHRSQHRTSDGRLTWSKDHDPDALLDYLEKELP